MLPFLVELGSANLFYNKVFSVLYLLTDVLGWDIDYPVNGQVSSCLWTRSLFSLLQLWTTCWFLNPFNPLVLFHQLPRVFFLFIYLFIFFFWLLSDPWGCKIPRIFHYSCCIQMKWRGECVCFYACFGNFAMQRCCHSHIVCAMLLWWAYLGWLPGPHPAALSLPPSSARQGEKTRLKKSHESRHGQGDDLPVTIMGKTGFTWGTFSLLSNTNRVGSWETKLQQVHSTSSFSGSTSLLCSWLSYVPSQCGTGEWEMGAVVRP